MENLSEFADSLPESVQNIVDVIGLADTEKLVKAVGGTRFKFGKGKQETARLKLLQQTIGTAQTEKLLAVFGGDVMYIPRCQLALQKLRNRRFRAAYDELVANGASKAMALLQLCPEYGISQRTADGILQERETAAVSQGKLF